jgi:hypothetical protein
METTKPLTSTTTTQRTSGQPPVKRTVGVRVPPLLIAAVADRHGLGVLHYDDDYDLIAEKTDLGFESVWLAARGTL